MLKLPPPVWTAIYLAVATAGSWALGWPHVALAHIVPLGVALVVLGLVPPVWAAAEFRRAGTEIQPTSASNKALVTAGPYAFTRNPMYLGLVVISLGIAVWTGLAITFAVPILVFATANFVHIPFEEAKMRRQFDQAFDAYTRKVRRWL